MSNEDPLNTQLQIAKEAEAKFDQARQHFAAKNFEEALDCYLFAFDNGHLVAGWGGVRLSYIPGEIAKLGEAYPPAIQALRDRRDAREKLIASGETSFDLISEWTSLNNYLKEKGRELTFLDSLQTEGTFSKDLEEQLIRGNSKELIERREYKRLEKFLHRFVWEFLIDIANCQAKRDFPSLNDNEPGSISASEELATYKQMAVEEGVECFEIALGCGQYGAAYKIIMHLFSVSSDRQTLMALAKAAGRVFRKPNN